MLPRLRTPLPREQDVARLDVPVHQPLFVGGVERGGDLPDDRDGPFRFERPTLVKEGAEVGPFHVAHRDEEVATRRTAS